MDNNNNSNKLNDEAFNTTFDFNKKIIGIHFNKNLIAVLHMLSSDIDINIALSKSVIKTYKRLLAKQNNKFITKTKKTTRY